MKKLIDRLYKLVDQRQLRFWNGTSIKESITDLKWDDVKTFQINKVKYKLILSVRRTCNHQSLIVGEPEIILLNLTGKHAGRNYTGYIDIAAFLGLTTNDVQQIFAPLLIDTEFTNDELILVENEYNHFLEGFKRDFCL